MKLKLFILLGTLCAGIIIYVANKLQDITRNQQNAYILRKCDVASFHPDLQQAEKEFCRKLRSSK